MFRHSYYYRLYTFTQLSHSGHVIPSDHLFPICLCKGPSGVEFEFTYQQRNTPALVCTMGREIGIAIWKSFISKIVHKSKFYTENFHTQLPVLSNCTVKNTRI